MKEYNVPILIKTTETVWADTWEEAIDKMARCSNYIVDYETIDNLQNAKVFPQRELKFTYWLEKYKPFKNPLAFFKNTIQPLDNFKNKEFYHYLFSPNFEQLETLAVLPKEVIWTLVNVDPCIDYNEPDKEFRILSGFYDYNLKFSNDAIVEGYFLTEEGVDLQKSYQIIFN